MKTPGSPLKNCAGAGIARTMGTVHQLTQRKPAHRCNDCEIPLSVAAPAWYRYCAQCWRYRRLAAALIRFAGSRV
jgi:hypothetical protein